MLLYTPEQQATVLANRRMFNDRQRSLQAMLGNTAMVPIGNASVLPKDVWGEWDKEAVDIQRDVLSIFNSLAGSVSRPMNLGKLVHYFQTVSDSGEVGVSLDGRSKARTDQPTIDYAGTPLPIFDSTFSYGWRQMLAAETEGWQIDSASRDNSNRKVAERLEKMVLDGESSIVVNGAVLYGMRNHPKRRSRATGVTLNGATGAQWMAEILATIKLLHAVNFLVPVTLYLNWADWFYATTTDFSAAYPNKTIMTRLMETGSIKEVIPASKMNPNEIFALVKDRRVVQILNGMPINTRAQFRANPEDDYNFVVMASAAIELKYDAANQMGLAHSS